MSLYDCKSKQILQEGWVRMQRGQGIVVCGRLDEVGEDDATSLLHGRVIVVLSQGGGGRTLVFILSWVMTTERVRVQCCPCCPCC